MFGSVRCSVVKCSSLSSNGVRSYRTRSTYSKKTTHDLIQINERRKRARKQTTKLLRTIRDPMKPKRPQSAWAKFTQQQYQQVPPDPDTGKKPLLKTLLPGWSQKWQTLSEAEKQRYGAAQEEWQNWKAQNSYYYSSGRYQRWLATARSLKACKPTSNGYFLFVKEWNATHTRLEGEKAGGRTVRAAEAWNSLSEQEKQVYKSRAQADYQQWKEMVAQAQ